MRIDSTRTTIAPPSASRATRKCTITISGGRSYRIVASPSGASTTVSTATAIAVQKVQRGRCLAAQAVRIESVIGKIPKTRFPNSM